MKKLLFLLLLLSSSVLFSGCELFAYLFIMWACPGEEEPQVWVVDYPLEQGEYWVFENEITITEYEDGDYVGTIVIERQDSVVVIGEDELPNGAQGIRVVDYWSTDEESGEIHHFYSKENNGLYCLGVMYENGMNVYRNPIHPNSDYFIEMSPLPGHAIISRESYHEDGYTIESPMRKVMEAEYTQSDSHHDEAYGSYFDHFHVEGEWASYRIWKCCVIDKEYYTGGGVNIAVEDLLGIEGILKRKIEISNVEVLDEEGVGTRIFRQYKADIKLVDGTFMH